MNDNIVCIRHPMYSGLESPVLSCKFCCSKFLAKRNTTQVDPVEWVAKKMQEANEAIKQAALKDRK
jgi:hypothetical protein